MPNKTTVTCSPTDPTNESSNQSDPTRLPYLELEDLAGAERGLDGGGGRGVHHLLLDRRAIGAPEIDFKNQFVINRRLP